MVFVKTVVYNALGTLMPYPLGIHLVYEAAVSPEWKADSSLRRCISPRREGGIHYIFPQSLNGVEAPRLMLRSQSATEKGKSMGEITRGFVTRVG